VGFPERNSDLREKSVENNLLLAYGQDTCTRIVLFQSGFISALPYLTTWILSFVFSWICDSLVRRGWIKLTPARKIFNSIGEFKKLTSNINTVEFQRLSLFALAFFGAAIFVILLAHSTDRYWSVFFLTMTEGCTAGAYAGVQAGFVDLAPNFSGAISSVANFFAFCLGLCGPIIIGHIVTETVSFDNMVPYL